MRRDLAGQNFEGFILRLGDGSRWWMTAHEDAVSLVNKLAAIMELEKCASNGSAQLIFSRAERISDARGGAINAPPSHLRTWGWNAGWTSCDHKTVRIWRDNSASAVVCEVRNNQGGLWDFLSMWYSLQPVYERSIWQGGLPFHAGLAELDGKAVLLAAPGGVGKSTCCRRLPDYWKPLCDDETLVVLDTEHQYRAHPFPTWSEYLFNRANRTWNVQYSVPVCGLFFLEQAATDEIEPLGKGRAAVLTSTSAAEVCQGLWLEVGRANQRRELFARACEIVKTIPAFLLRVSLRGRFWEEIEKVLGR